MNIQEKICTICNVNKDINLFSNDIHKKDGKRPECKSCKQLEIKNIENLT